MVQQKKKPVYELGLDLFREKVWDRYAIKGRLSTILLGNVAAERTGKLVDRGLMKNVLGMLVEIGSDGANVYEADFEKQVRPANARTRNEDA